MKFKRLYIIFFLFSSLFFFSACTDNQKDLKAELNQSEANNLILQKQIDDLLVEISSLNLKETSLLLEIEELKNQIGLNDNQITEKNNQIALIQEELNLIQSQKAEKDLVLLGLKSDILELETKNSSLNEEIDSIYKLFNDISYTALKSNMMIKVEHTNFFGQGIASQGSGVIFYMDQKNYYVLTNAHVVYDEPSYSHISYYLYDYKGNKITASLHSSDPNYDLAILYFPKGNYDLDSLNFAQADPLVGETVISLGQPLGQINTISFGKIIRYQTLNVHDLKSNVEFQIINHNSPINSGSSGGVLLNTSLEIIGINYAGAGLDNEISLAAYAIPLSKIIEYLDLYNFNMQ